MTQRLAVLGLALGPEVTAAGLAAVQGVDAHELAQLEEVGDAAGLLERLVEGVGRTEDAHVAPELVAQPADEVDGLEQALLARAPCRSTPT